MQELIKEINIPDFILPRLIATGIILLLNPSLRFLAKKFTSKTGLLSSKSEMRINQIAKLVCMMINLTCIVTLAVIWGVEPRNMLIVLSSVFTIVGVAMFAQWSILSNITSGLVIFFSMPFRIGDEIQILDKDYPITATVENVLTFTIHLRTDDGSLVIMSNTMFMQRVFSIKEPR